MVRRRVAEVSAVELERVAATLAGFGGDWTNVAALADGLALPPQLTCRIDERLGVVVAYATGAPPRADALHRSLRGRIADLRGAPHVLAGPGAIVRWIDAAHDVVLQLSRTGATVTLAVIPWQLQMSSERSAFAGGEAPHTWSIAIDPPHGYVGQHGTTQVSWELFARNFTALVPSLVADVALLADLMTEMYVKLESAAGRCSLYIAPPKLTLFVDGKRWGFVAPDAATIAQLAPRMLDAVACGPTTDGLTYSFGLVVDERTEAPPDEAPPARDPDEEYEDGYASDGPPTEVDAHLAYEPDEVDPEDEELHAEPDAYAGLRAAHEGNLAIVARETPVDEENDDDDDDDDVDGDPDRVDPARIAEAPPADAAPVPVVRPIASGRDGVIATMPGLGVRPPYG